MTNQAELYKKDLEELIARQMKKNPKETIELLRRSDHGNTR